jgi:two-component system, cell cycle sensor histidine kinase and response regulator CckA
MRPHRARFGLARRLRPAPALADPDPQSAGTRGSQRVLKSERDAYRSVFEHNPVPMLLCDVGTLRVLAANQVAAKLHGASSEQMVGQSLFDLRRVSDLTSVMLKRAVGREIALGFGYHTRKDGSVFPVQLTVHPSELGGRAVWLCVLKSLEDALAPAVDEQQRRLDESIGRLSAGMAHDVNNLLSVILSFASLATSQLPDFAPARTDLGEIRGAAERAAAITKQLLGLSRKTPAAPKTVVLNDVVRRVEKLLRRLLDDHLTLEIALEPQLQPVLADTPMLERLLVQLVGEARSSSPRGGTLRIETRNVTLDAQHGDGRHVMLRISDSGTGLSPEVATRLFEPIAGTAWLESEPGSGTRFVTCFPSLAAADARAGSEQRKARRETVLVVQDNPHLRKTLKTYFAREGYQVLDADCSIEAARLAEQAPRVDLLLTDYVLPDGGGLELGAALRLGNPELKVLITVGYPEQRAAVPEDDRTATISKPFDLRQFGELIERLLEPQARS